MSNFLGSTPPVPRGDPTSSQVLPRCRKAEKLGSGSQMACGLANCQLLAANCFVFPCGLPNNSLVPGEKQLRSSTLPNFQTKSAHAWLLLVTILLIAVGCCTCGRDGWPTLSPGFGEAWGGREFSGLRSEKGDSLSRAIFLANVLHAAASPPSRLFCPSISPLRQPP